MRKNMKNSLSRTPSFAWADSCSDQSEWSTVPLRFSDIFSQMVENF